MIFVAQLSLTLFIAVHHSFVAEYNTSKSATVTGAVTKLLWENPHAFLVIEGKSPRTGQIEDWSIELGSVNSLVRLGWTKNSIRINEVVTVQGILAVSGENRILARGVTLRSSGVQLQTSSSER